MKNLYAAFAAFLLSLLAMHGQQQRVVTLDHDGTFTHFYGTSAFQDAYDAAADGDAIYLSSGSYEGFEISKGVTIRGAGMGTMVDGELVSNVSSSISGNTATLGATLISGQMTLNCSLQALYVEGLRVNEMRLNSTAENSAIVRCYLEYIGEANDQASGINMNFINTLMPQNYLHSSGNALAYQNCYVNLRNGTTEAQITAASSVIDGYVAGFQSDSNCAFQGCIFISNEQSPANCTLSDCLLLYDRQPDSSCITSNAMTAGDPSEVFASSTYYQLTDDAAALYVDSSGDQVGLYGGTIPFAEYTTNPHTLVASLHPISVKVLGADNLQTYVDDVLLATLPVSDDGTLEISLALSPLTFGAHTLTAVAVSNDGLLSSPLAYCFLKGHTFSKKDAVRMSVYLDGEQVAQTEASQALNDTNFDIDISQLATGLHTLMAVAYSDDGTMSAPHTSIIYVAPDLAKQSASQVRLYVDGELKETKAAASTVTFDYDASGFKTGLHTVMAEAVNADGTLLSSPHTYIVYAAPELSKTEAASIRLYVDGVLAETKDAQSTVAFDYDASGFKTGLHTVMAEAVNADGTRLSSPHTSIYYKEPELSKKAATTARLYVDGIYRESRDLVARSTAFNFDFDNSELAEGWHSLLVMASAEDGTLSSPQLTFFLKDLSETEYDEAKCYYCIDEGEYIYAGTVTRGDFSFSIDTSELNANQFHRLTCVLVLPDGTISSIDSIEFLAKPQGMYPADHPELESLSIETTLDYGVALSWADLQVQVDEILSQALASGYDADQVFQLEKYQIYHNGDLVGEQNVTTYGDNTINLLDVNEFYVIAVYDDGYQSVSPTVTAKQQLAAPTIRYSSRMIWIEGSYPEGTKIYYAVYDNQQDNPMPKRDGSVYVQPFELSTSGYIYAYAEKEEDYFDSEIQMYHYEIVNVTCGAPTITVTDTTVSMSSDTEGASIYYTLNGTDPTADNGTAYSAPFKIAENCTIKAIAARSDLFESPVTTYTVTSFTCDKPVISLSGTVISISCSTENAAIYYTLDGSDPTQESALYSGAFEISSNCTVKAIAMKANFNNSEIASYIVISFICDKPVISVTLGVASMTCATEGATIYYTLDGTQPNEESPIYSEPVVLAGTCTIKAIAVKANFNDSYVSIYNYDENVVTCFMPTITVSGNTVKLATDTEGASIYYTLDGTVPSASSTLYSGAFTLEGNCTIKAIAIKEGYFDSDVNTKVVDSFKCSAPTITVNGNTVTLVTDTEGASIYYTLDGTVPSASSTLYSGAFTLEGDCIVKAIAMRDGWNDSEISTLVVDWFECENVALDYDGRYATITSPDQDVTIYYTIDDGSRIEYVEPFDIEGAAKISAWSSKENYNDSPVLVYAVGAYFDGETAICHVPGRLAEGFQWFEALDQLSTIVLQGEVNDDDASIFRSMPSLGAVQWQCAESAVPAGIFDFNSNLLLYVNDSSLAAGSGVRNVVVNGYADSIELDGDGNFCVPQAFQAATAKYTRAFSMETALDGDTQGWETLTLPFDVETITHLGGSSVQAKGEIKPFAAFATADYSAAKPFWLHRMDISWLPAEVIEAYVPYVISMPNNSSYAEEYILAGEVEFTSTSADFPETVITEAYTGNYRFAGTTMRLSQSEEYAPVNAAFAGGKAADTGGYLEGSTFVPGLRDVVPFEAYLADANGGRMGAPVRLADLGSQLGAIPSEIIGDSLWRVYSYDGVLYISTSLAQRVTLYSLGGKALRILDLQPGLNEVHDLTTGVYILRNSKVFVEMKHL